MKCPKCAYVGFDALDRCRHCGYDFSLMGPGASGPAAQGMALDIDPPLPATPRPEPPLDLPLRSVESRVPALFADPAPPPAGAPLAVRRPVERPRTRPMPRLVRTRPMLDELDVAETEPVAPGPTPVVAAAFATRLVAAFVDLGVLVVVDVAVVYLTTQIAGLALDDVMALPLVPLGLFLAGVDLAYLCVFTAHGGQTLGKMAMGLRVDAMDGRLSAGRAVLRVMVSVVGGVALGLGFAVAALRQDGRALHDQVAGTHVVKVGNPL